MSAQNSPQRIPIGSPPAVPPNQQQLIGWYLASTNVQTPATKVASWADSSGLSHPLTQAATSKQPAVTVANASFGGKPTVDFVAASSQFLQGAFSTAPPFDIFVVGMWNSAFSSAACMIDGFGGNQVRIERTAASTIQLQSGSAPVVVTTATPQSPHIYNAKVSKGGAYSLSQDGNEIGRSVGPGATTFVGPIVGIFGDAASNPADVSVAEILVYSSIQSPRSTEAIQAYLKAQYATP